MEFVRHRVFSFAQESTRYCNYSKDKFDKEITYIIPPWMDIPVGSYTDSFLINKRNGEKIQGIEHIESGSTWNVSVTSEGRFLIGLLWDERYYMDLLSTYNWTPQQARAILPNSLKTELVMTGTVEQWKGFFKLRCDKAAHPQARELAVPLKEEFIKRNLINN